MNIAIPIPMVLNSQLLALFLRPVTARYLLNLLAHSLALTTNRLYNLLMSQPFKLHRLQQIDTQLDQKRLRLAEIELILADDAELQVASRQLQSAESSLQEADRALRRAEADVQAQKVKIEQNEAALYGGKVRNPKELQDLQNESAALKRYLSVLEDRQLEAMIAAEEAETQHEQASSTLSDLKARRIEANAALLGEQTILFKDISRLENERSAAVSTIDQADVQLYEQLRLTRRGVAVAMIQDNACMACGSTLTPGTIQTAQSGGTLTRCTFCGRILYIG
jgi:uncharacterized protein